MKIVIPERVDTIAPLLVAAPTYVLWLVLRHDDGWRPPAISRTRLCQGSKDMLGGLIIDILCCIKPQAVEMKLGNPVTCIGNKELAHRSGVLAIEVDAPRPNPSCSGR